MSHYRKHRNKNNQPAESATSSQGTEESVVNSASAATEHELLVGLFRELFQTEQSAKLHPVREANRLGDVPPATALRMVAAHAESVMQELPALAEKNQLPISGAGIMLGSFLSNCRQLVIDRIVEPERSYRGTLIGMRHGVDLVGLIRHVARVQNNRELAAWCENWLDERTPLVEAVAKELAWFAQTPEAATTQPVVLKLVSRIKSLIPGASRPHPGAAAS